MSCHIKQTDRMLIDQAIAAGKVTKVAHGASSSFPEFVWDGKKLVSKDPVAASQRYRDGNATTGASRVRIQTARREKVKKLHDLNPLITPAQIAATTGYVASTIESDFRFFGWNILKLRAASKGHRFETTAERHAFVREQRAKGVLLKVIAAEANVKLNLIQQDVRRLKLTKRTRATP